MTEWEFNQNSSHRCQQSDSECLPTLSTRPCMSSFDQLKNKNDTYSSMHSCSFANQRTKSLTVQSLKKMKLQNRKTVICTKNQSSNILMDPMGQHEPLLSHVQYTYCYCRCVFTKTCLKFVQWKDTLSTDCHRTIYLLNICNTTMSLWFTLSQGMTYEKLLWWNGHQKMVVPA